jgi:transcription elongation factor GreB
MSKAFTRESDDEPELLPPVRAPLPFGVKNYVTPAGANQLRERLAEMLARPEKTPLVEARVRQLEEVIPTLVVADPPADKSVVRFGAEVRLRRGNEVESYQLVGVDEVDLDANKISWISPLAKALLGKKAGDQVRFGSPADRSTHPAGAEELEILSVSYR